MKYFGLDGDSIGRVIESYLIENDVKKLKEFSSLVVSALEKIKQLAIEKNAEVIFCTGDSILIYGDLEIDFGNKIVNLFNEVTEKTASVGIGDNLAKAYLGLKLAKSKGGNQAIEYKMK